MRPKFKYNDLKNLHLNKQDTGEWEKENDIEKDWMTPERIPIKSVYTKDDLEGMEHLNYAAGIASFFARAIFRNVCNASMDNQAICRIFNC